MLLLTFLAWWFVASIVTVATYSLFRWLYSRHTARSRSATLRSAPGARKLAHMREARDNARAEVERLTALVAEVRDAMEDESNLDGWVGNYVRTSTIRRILDGAES